MHPVEPDIALGDTRRHRVDVAREHRAMCQSRDGDGEDARSGADVERVPDRPGADGALDSEQAAGGRAVVAGAESLARLDFDGDVIGPALVAVVRAVDQEAAGAHRLEAFKRLRDPVGLRQARYDEARGRRAEHRTRRRIEMGAERRVGALRQVENHLPVARSRLEGIADEAGERIVFLDRRGQTARIGL